MKQAIILALAIFSLSSCANGKPCAESHPKSEPQIIEQPVSAAELHRIEDSIFTIHNYKVDELILENQLLQTKVDSMQITSDTLARRLLHARLMIENARYYLKIAIRSPSQDKFLKGWMRRALEVP